MIRRRPGNDRRWNTNPWNKSTEPCFTLERQLIGDGILDEVLDTAVALLAPAKQDVATDSETVRKQLTQPDTEVQRIIGMQLSAP